MPAPLAPIPAGLAGRPVTADQCRAAGISPDIVRRRFAPMFRGVWWFGPLPTDLIPWLRAALTVLPSDVVVSHLTALRLYGVEMRSMMPLHFSRRSTSRAERPRIVMHRRCGLIREFVVGGFVTTSPERAFVDSATILGLRDLVRVGDALVHGGHVTLEQLIDFCMRSHLDGVIRARRAVLRVREGVESFLETDVRLLLEFARLPVDGCNLDIVDDSGHFVARGDILFRRFKVLVEYDGWHHERDARQRQRDHLRRERLEAAGWIVIVVTVGDMKDPLGIVRRVHAALLRRGFTGTRPVLSDTWHRWFAA